MDSQIVYPKACPICHRPSAYAKSVSENENKTDPALWYMCSCGVCFQGDVPEGVIKDKTFVDAHYKTKEYEIIGCHAARQYAPLIEELTYGRKVLDVGFGTGITMKFLSERGWIPFGIETNKDTVENQRIIKDDFETTDKLYIKTYDLIWMSAVLEKFKNPLGALQKAYNVLQEDGVIYIATPDIDFLYNKPGGMFPHWNKKENYVLWNEKSLCRELEKIGFNIIMKRRNYYQRFGYYYDIHIIAQKIFF